MRLRLFLKSGIWDLLLVCAEALALNYAVLSGFDSTVDLRSNFLLQLAIALPMFAVLFWGSWSKRNMIFSIGGAAALSVVALGVGIATTPSNVGLFADGQVNDVAGNNAIFCFTTLFVSILSYLLTRRPVGALILLVFGTIVCGGVQFLFPEWLYGEGGLADFIVFFGSGAAMLIYQRYRCEAAKADILAKPAFMMAFVQAVVCVIACLGIGFLAWGGVISQLGLQTPEIKPFEKTISRPVVEYSVVYGQMRVEDIQNNSSLTNGLQNETQQNAEGGIALDDPTQGPSDNPMTEFVKSIMMFNQDDLSESFDPSFWEKMEMWGLIAAGILVLLVVDIILLRRSMRWIRLKRWNRLPYGQRVKNAYAYLLKSFKKLGFLHKASATPLEYAFDKQDEMIPFTKGTGKTDFVDVTLIYQRAAFGGGDVSKEDWGKVERFYRRFFGNARTWVGPVRWLRYFWKI